MLGIGILGRLGGIGTSLYDRAALAFFARLTNQPTPARATLYNNLFVSLRNAGILSLLDALYITAAADSQAATRNLIQNAYNLTAVNAPTFTVDRGYAGNGSTSYLDTNFNPTTAVSATFTQNSGHISLYDRTTRGVVGGSIEMGLVSGVGETSIAVDAGAGNTYGNVNSLASLNFASAGSTGHFIADRTGPAANAIYRNGVSQITGNGASQALVNGNIFIGGRNSAGALNAPSTDQIASATIGGGLTSAQALAFYNAIQAYMTGVGANV